VSVKRRKFQPKVLVSGVILGLVVGWSIIDLGINPRYLVEGVPHFASLVREMIPPAWGVFGEGRVLWSVVETIAIAFVGTVIGAAISFFLGLLAAANIAPRVVSEIVRGIAAAERALPEMVVLLILTVVVGLGPPAVVIALAIGCIGMLVKLFAETIETVDPRPLEALESVGATKLQIIRWAVLPQVLPSLIANTLYRNDINLRSALFLGMVGGAGIGFELHRSLRIFRYPEALAITAVVLVIIMIMEKISDTLRKRIIGQEILQ